MDRSAKLWQIIAAAVGVIVTCYTIVKNNVTDNTEQKVKIQFMQQQMTEMSVNMQVDRKESKERDDRMLNMLIDIQMNLKDKQDRK